MDVIVMKLKDYPYGKVTKTLKKAVTWLRSNKKKIQKEQEDCFDFPNYWNMPKTICNRLNGDEVDWIQYETYDWYK
jgi:hypothetical protein